MTSSAPRPHPPCATLIGMAGAGKSTVGRLVAEGLGFAHLDTDDLICAAYARPLQDAYDFLGRERFLAAEEELVARLDVTRCVVSTGGSVVYGPRAVARLRSLGPVVHLYADLDSVAARVAHNPQRGLCIAPGQTLAELCAEREPLYRAAADFILDSSGLDPRQCAAAVLDWLAGQGFDRVA
ncbi:MAG: homoserine kinase [Thermodesulfobacteriota bacterium]